MDRAPTVLVVDDDRATQRVLADALSQEGFSVLVEKDGEWALKTFEKKDVDAVILDLLLPGAHGFEVARQIRSLPKGENVPLIFISGVYKSQSTAADAQAKYGVAGYLDKPLNLGQLKGLLRDALAERYPAGDAEAERRAKLDARSGEGFADEQAREEAAQVEVAARKSAVQTIRGDFQNKPFPELLAELYRWRATGALLLRRDKIKKIVFFRDGRPFSIKSNLLSECLGKIMVREKMISEAECEESLRRMKESSRQQGTVLIEMGCISPHNLTYALALQLQTKLYDLFAWTSGEYQFNPRAEVPSESNTLDLTTAQIIYEGVKRSYDEVRVTAALGAVEPLYVHPAIDPLLRFQDVGLDQEESALLAAIDGHKTVATLTALELLPPEGTLKFLYAMRCAQLIDLRAEPAAGPVETRFAKPMGAALDEAVTEEISIPPPRPPRVPHAPPPLPPTPAQPPPIRAAAPQPQPQPPPPVRPHKSAGSLLPELSGVHQIGAAPEEREIRERLAATASAMKKKDYFQVLGVSPEADKEEIRQAYFALAKEYHPDKHFGSYSAEVRNLASQIFELVVNAHDTLTNDEERERYLAELGDGVKRDVSDEVGRILAAEGKFQKGEELLRKKQFKEARDSFAEAVRLYADEGEFHAYLGWSLFQASPESKDAAERAIEHIERGIRLNPKVDKSYLFLGYIYKSISRPDRAEKQFEKAIQCNPDCIEALRELRLLGKGRKSR